MSVCDGLRGFQSSTATSWIFAPGGLFAIFGGVDLLNTGDPTTPGNIPDVLPDGSLATLASGFFIGAPTLTFLSYDPALDHSILTFDAELNGILLPQLADAFGFVGTGLGSLFLNFTVPGLVSGGTSFQGDTLLEGHLSFNGLPQTPEPSPALLLSVFAPVLLYVLVRRRRRANST
jgi:hypothetical protein